MGCTSQAHYYVCQEHLVTESRVYVAGSLASESLRAVPLSRLLA